MDLPDFSRVVRTGVTDLRHHPVLGGIDRRQSCLGLGIRWALSWVGDHLEQHRASAPTAAIDRFHWHHVGHCHGDWTHVSQFYLVGVH